MTDNLATSYFQSQKKLSPKQLRCQDFLAEFDMVLEYKPGRTKQVADALSRKAELVASMQEGKTKTFLGGRWSALHQRKASSLALRSGPSYAYAAESTA